MFDEVLADIHKRTFRYFWETADPQTGLAPDKWPLKDFCSVAAVGFCLSAYVIAPRPLRHARRGGAADASDAEDPVERAPGAGADRGDGLQGFFYHFLDMKTGLRYRDCELSSVDTALCLAGVLTAGGLFRRQAGRRGGDPQAGHGAVQARRLDVHGAQYGSHQHGFSSRAGPARPRRPRADRPQLGPLQRRQHAGLHPGHGLADHPIRHETWQNWEKTLPPEWSTNFHETYLSFSPLFGISIRTSGSISAASPTASCGRRGSTYFENSQKATIAQRNYAIRNPGQFRDYGSDVWGLTACMGPGQMEVTVGGREIHFEGYIARGIQDGDWESSDDGTIAPAAGLGSIAFTPDICTDLAHTLRTRYGDDIYGDYGFFDAFNPTFPADVPSDSGHATKSAGWVASQYLGIDQGPILCMLENYRSGLLWGPRVPQSADRPLHTPRHEAGRFPTRK